eukprot:812841_1
MMRICEKHIKIQLCLRPKCHFCVLIVQCQSLLLLWLWEIHASLYIFNLLSQIHTLCANDTHTLTSMFFSMRALALCVARINHFCVFVCQFLFNILSFSMSCLIHSPCST